MFFKHYKGRYYQGIGYVTEANTDETMVLYIPLYDCGNRCFVRPYINFTEYLECDGMRVQRFAPILEYELPDETKLYIYKEHDIGALLCATRAFYGNLVE